jgi:hypothetical protein
MCFITNSDFVRIHVRFPVVIHLIEVSIVMSPLYRSSHCGNAAQF